jgi:hypothetical protein
MRCTVDCPMVLLASISFGHPFACATARIWPAAPAASVSSMTEIPGGERRFSAAFMARLSIDPGEACPAQALRGEYRRQRRADAELGDAHLDGRAHRDRGRGRLGEKFGMTYEQSTELLKVTCHFKPLIDAAAAAIHSNADASSDRDDRGGEHKNEGDGVDSDENDEGEGSRTPR